MTVRTGIWVLLIAASTAWAQSVPVKVIDDTRKQVKGSAVQQKQDAKAKASSSNSAKQQSAPSVAATTAAKKQQEGGSIKPSSSGSGKPQSAPPVVVKSAHQKAGKATSAKAPAKAKPVVSETKPKQESTTAQTEAQPSEEKKDEPEADTPEASERQVALTRRDRRDPFQTVIRATPAGPSCTSGKKCLVVDKMDLKGIVRSQNGMIAIVENQQRKTYFLHENDPVFNGHVLKINPDSVVFKETVTDRIGRQSTREVVKRISRPAV